MYGQVMSMELWVNWEDNKPTIMGIFLDKISFPGALKNGTTKENVEQIVIDTINQLPNEIKSQHVSIKYSEAFKKKVYKSLPKEFVMNEDKEDICINCKHWCYTGFSEDPDVRYHTLGYCEKHDSPKLDDSTCKAWESDEEGKCINGKYY